MSNAEVADDILGKRSTRKRGNSRYPRRCQLLLLVSSSFSFNYFQLLIIQILNISNLNISEPPRLTSRGRRSTSLPKEVILDESIYLNWILQLATNATDSQEPSSKQLSRVLPQILAVVALLFSLLNRDFQIDSERKTSARIQRHPRTCFVLPKKKKKKIILVIRVK